MNLAVGRVVEFRPDAVVFELEVRPGASVTHLPSGSTATATASGIARVEVPPDQAVDRATGTAELSVFAPATTFLGADQRASVSILVGFDPTPLASVSSPDSRSWVLGFGASDAESELLLRLVDVPGEAPRLGRVLVPQRGGIRWVGPPGTTLTIGPSTLTIPESGELRWTPSDAELFGLLRPAAISSEVDVAVSSPGRPEERGLVNVSKEPAADGRLGAYLRAIGTGETPPPSTPVTDAATVPVALVVRLDGSLELSRARGLRVPSDLRFESLSFYAFEEEVSRRPSGETCTVTADEPMFRLVDSRTQNEIDRPSSTTIEPELVQSRVVMRRGLTGPVVAASDPFPPPTSVPCEPSVFPLAPELTRWVDDQLSRLPPNPR